MLQSRRKSDLDGAGSRPLGMVFWWLPAIGILVIWLAFFLVSERTPTQFAHMTFGRLWELLPHSFLIQVTALLFALLSGLILAIGVLRRDQRFVAMAVFILLAGLLISIIVMTLVLLGSMGA